MSFIGLLFLCGPFLLSFTFGHETNDDEPVDALRAIASLPQCVLKEATMDAPMFQCLTSDLTAFDASARTATYTWHIKGQDGQPQQDIVIDFVISKDAPDSGLAYINSDTSNPIPVQAVYSDYKSCLIDKMFLESGELCLQWVSPGTENHVPEACRAAFIEKCGRGVALYKDQVCK